MGEGWVRRGPRPCRISGVSIAFEDLLIGTTALHLRYAVVTINVRHFQVIPGLTVVQL
jgi:predicted nucleic acid-binding protein